MLFRFENFKHMAPLPGFSLLFSQSFHLLGLQLSVKLWHSVVLILHMNTVLFGFQSVPLTNRLKQGEELNMSVWAVWRRLLSPLTSYSPYSNILSHTVTSTSAVYFTMNKIPQFGPHAVLISPHVLWCFFVFVFFAFLTKVKREEKYLILSPQLDVLTARPQLRHF